MNYKALNMSLKYITFLFKYTIVQKCVLINQKQKDSKC